MAVPKAYADKYVESLKYRIRDIMSYHHNTKDIGMIFDENAPCFDVVWIPPGGEAVQIVSLVVEYENVGPSTIFVRAQVPEAYAGDQYRLASWKNLQRGTSSPGRSRGRKKKRPKKTSKGGPLKSAFVIVPPKRRVIRTFRGFSSLNSPRMLSVDEEKGNGTTGWHLLSYAAMKDGDISDSGMVINVKVPALAVSVTVVYHAAAQGLDQDKRCIIQSTNGYSRMDYIDKPPTPSVRVGDLVSAGGTIAYAYTKCGTDKYKNRIGLVFVDQCGNQSFDPMGLDKDKVYVSDLSIVDEIQGATKITVGMQNFLAWSQLATAWQFGALTVGADGKVGFAHKDFASDPGKLFLPASAIMRVYSDVRSFDGPKTVNVFCTKKMMSRQHITHSATPRVNGQLSADPATVITTAITVLSCVISVLNWTLALFDSPGKSSMQHAGAPGAIRTRPPNSLGDCDFPELQ